MSAPRVRAELRRFNGVATAVVTSGRWLLELDAEGALWCERRRSGERLVPLARVPREAREVMRARGESLLVEAGSIPPARPSRPPRAGEAATRELRVRVTEVEYAAYAATAKSRGVTLSELVREALAAPARSNDRA